VSEWLNLPAWLVDWHYLLAGESAARLVAHQVLLKSILSRRWRLLPHLRRSIHLLSGNQSAFLNLFPLEVCKLGLELCIFDLLNRIVHSQGTRFRTSFLFSIRRLVRYLLNVLLRRLTWDLIDALETLVNVIWSRAHMPSWCADHWFVRLSDFCLIRILASNSLA